MLLLSLFATPTTAAFVSRCKEKRKKKCPKETPTHTLNTLSPLRFMFLQPYTSTPQHPLPASSLLTLPQLRRI